MRERRRRRRTVLAVVGSLVVLAVPIGLAVASSLAERQATDGEAASQPDSSPPDADDPSGGDDGGAPDVGVPDEGAPDEGAPETDAPDGGGPDADGPGARDDAPLVPPDLDALSGTDAVYGQLLIDIDASELVMIGFQDDLRGIFSGSNGERAAQAVTVAAAQRRDELAQVRERLDVPLADGGADEVRTVYVDHLDSWLRYMDAVAEDPAALLPEGPGAGYTLDINATADAFARALEEAMPEDLAPVVRDYADGILDRGFRSTGAADV